MCKVMIITNITDKTRSKALTFIKEMATKISVNNNDGLGYAALDSQENLFVERWFKNDTAFSKPIDSPFNNAVSFKPIEYNSEGVVNLNDVVAMTLHTRFATCEKSLKNTHPFVKDGTSLIHNGVIRNPEVYKPTISTCDSESLLNGYLQYDLANNHQAIEQMVKPLEGYWAAAAFSKVNNRYVLDIFKHSASLSVVYVYDLETWVFSTSNHDIETVCNKLGFKYSEVGTVEDDVFIRLNPMSGEVLLTDSYIKESYVKPTTKTSTYNPGYYSPYTSNYTDDYYGEGYHNFKAKKESTQSSNCLTYSELKKERDKTKSKAVVTVMDGKMFSEYVMGIKTK